MKFLVEAQLKKGARLTKREYADLAKLVQLMQGNGSLAFAYSCPDHPTCKTWDLVHAASTDAVDRFIKKNIPWSAERFTWETYPPVIQTRMWGGCGGDEKNAKDIMKADRTTQEARCSQISNDIDELEDKGELTPDEVGKLNDLREEYEHGMCDVNIQ